MFIYSRKNNKFWNIQAITYFIAMKNKNKLLLLVTIRMPFTNYMLVKYSRHRRAYSVLLLWYKPKIKKTIVYCDGKSESGYH